MNRIRLKLAYISQFSKWQKVIPKLPFDDFYKRKVIYEDRFRLHKYVFGSEKLCRHINYLKFRTANGISINWWANENKNQDSGFTDSIHSQNRPNISA
jgi:hypothetical protein